MNVVAPFPALDVQSSPLPERSRSATWTCDFLINGRFLSQPVTGVQRYARETVAALDSLLGRSNGTGRIATPRNAVAIPHFGAIDVARIGLGKGHFWEQSALPLHADRPILSLCNTGPALVARQTVCIHDVNVFREPDSYSASFRLAYKTLLPLLVKRVDSIATVSHFSRRELANVFSIDPQRITVMPNGHEHALRWRPRLSSLADRSDLDRPFVFLLGVRARHKNIGLVLRQAQALDDLGLNLVVAGGTANIFSDAAAVRHPNIRWLGRVSDDDLAYLYSRALCLAFPSKTEGFGLPIVEAMALGCPVVASDRGSMLEVCGNAALLASPDDPDAWHRAFAALARSAALQTELRERGRIRVKQFSWTATARAYLELHGRVP